MLYRAVSHEWPAQPMTTPPSGSFPEIARPASVHNMDSGRPPPVDSPYTSARSHSGHLIPYSPAPARRHSRDYVSWMTGSQTSFHDDPCPINCDTPQAGSFRQPGPSTTVHTYQTHQLHPGIAAEMLSGNPTINPFPQSAHIYLSANRLGSHRSAPSSIRSSTPRSVSQNSLSSTGQASYREYNGPRPRVRTPVREQFASIPGSLSSSISEKAEPGSSAVFRTLIAPPSADDPNTPGVPVLASPSIPYSLGEPHGHRFFPMSVSGVLRYDGNRKIRPASGNDYTIGAMLYQYPKTPEVPRGWTACRHPEGALYFVHEESRTFTEVNICDEAVHGDIEYFREFLISELKDEIKMRNISEFLDVSEVELVLEPKRDDDGVICCYYFVNPSARSLFWLDEWTGDEIFKDCKGKLSPTHKGLAIQAQYWYAVYLALDGVFLIFNDSRNHWDLFPDFCKVTQELKDEVVDMILHATCDHLTSNTSTCPLSLEELKNHLAVVDRINPEKTSGRGHRAVVIGRVMHAFYHAYFINYYGEDCARLNCDQTVHGWRYHPSLSMTIFAPLLFMVPVNNVRLLHKIFVDDIASKERWNTFVTRLNSQLQATSVLATVLLNANVGLLPKEPSSTSPDQYLIYMSLVASMASIILGLVFMGNNRIEEKIDPLEAANFLSGLRHDRHGLETLAIIYSLPHAFLMWGMFLFLAGFAAQWYYPGDTIWRAGGGAFILAVAFLVAWCIWTTRDLSELWWFQPDPYRPGRDELGGEQEDSGVSFGIPGLGFFRRFTTSLFGG